MTQRLIRSLLVIATALSSAIAVPAYKGRKSPGFVVKVDIDGTYDIQVNGKTWLPSADTYFYADGAKYSSADGSLKLVQTTASSGVNRLGEWESTDFRYNAGTNVITASVKSFANVNAVVFTQKYTDSMSGTTSGHINTTTSAFPSFKIAGEPNQLGYLTYGGHQFGSSFSTGQWTQSTAQIYGGALGGPLLLFDHDQNVLIIAPFSQFMAASIYQEAGAINCGIMGGVNEIPAMYESSFIVYYNDRGINEAMRQWGELMRFYYNRDESFRESDLTVNYLGFWMDNGAYYYWNTGAEKSFEDVILDLKIYADEMTIPYRYIQIDDWWYHWGSRHGDVTWEPRPGVFPDGLQYVYNKTGLPYLAHNKYWSTNTTYAKQNGGKYDFIVESVMALPNDTTFWPDLLQDARKWGLIVYEQDFLDNQFLGMNATLSSVSLGRDWLMQMGEGAAKNGLAIQYCMSLPRHDLQALEIPAVTQARVSHDFHAGTTQWQIGVTSMFAEAMGLAPFKDNFWSRKIEPGNKYHLNATQPALEALVSTLSTGPVGPSDMVGGSDVSLIMRCCNADGLILKPSRPARNIDSNILQHAFGDSSGPDGEVWATISRIYDFTFGTVLAPIQSSSYKLTPVDAGFGADLPPTVIFKHTWPMSGGVANFSQNAPLTISGCSTADPCLWHTSPVVNLGSSQVYMYGELQKWVPMSPKRVTSIDISDDIYVTLVGAVDETVEFSFGMDFGAINTISCNLGLSGSAIVALMGKSCRPL